MCTRLSPRTYHRESPYPALFLFFSSSSSEIACWQFTGAQTANDVGDIRWDHQLYHALDKQRNKEAKNNPREQPQKPATPPRRKLRTQAEELLAKNMEIETIEVEKELSV